MTSDDFSLSCENAEWMLRGTPDSIKVILIQAAEDFRTDTHYFQAKERPGRTGLPFIQVEALGVQQGMGAGAIGTLHVHSIDNGRSRVLIRPDGSRPSSIAPRLFSAYLARARSDLLRLGFLANSLRFNSYEVLRAAEREIGAADEPAALAAVGNMFRSAVIDLANELYTPSMSRGAAEPRGDDASEKLHRVAKFYFAGRSGQFLIGLEKSIDGSWKMISALLHRKSATREEVQACAALVRNLFEAFSFIVPS